MHTIVVDLDIKTGYDIFSIRCVKQLLPIPPMLFSSWQVIAGTLLAVYLGGMGSSFTNQWGSKDCFCRI
jgi:hypothetical protein